MSNSTSDPSKAFSIDSEGEGAEVPTLTSLLYRKKKVNQQGIASAPKTPSARESLEPTKTGTVTQQSKSLEVSELGSALEPLTKRADLSHLATRISSETTRGEKTPAEVSTEDLSKAIELLNQALNQQSVLKANAGVKMQGQAPAEFFQKFISQQSECIYLFAPAASGDLQLKRRFEKQRRSIEEIEQISINPEALKKLLANAQTESTFVRPKTTDLSTECFLTECSSVIRTDDPAELFKLGLRRSFATQNQETLLILAKFKNDGSQKPVFIAWNYSSKVKFPISEFSSIWNQLTL